jgi:hypothetical protein
VPEFAGTKLTQDAKAACDFPDLHKVDVRKGADRILTDHAGAIGDGGNSGFQAINVAAQFGPRRLVLLGFDMRIDRGAHWHGRHPPGLNNPTDRNLVRWRLVIDRSAAELAALGIEVVNASPVSLLNAFPVMSIEDALK